MKYMDEDFLLQNEWAKTLYHEHAEKMPIFDFHNHLDAEEIFKDKKFDSITSFWLIDESGHGDHYKWRLMRACGIDEFYIKGKASPKVKFLMWMKTLRSSIGNPLYEWSILELKRYFGLDDPLAYADEELYDLLNSKLPSLSVRSLLRKSKVKAMATTNDPIETLEWHRALKNDESNEILVVPTFRPDKITNISNSASYRDYIKTLSDLSSVNISSYKSLLEVCERRLLFFKECGSFISDHSIETLEFKQLGYEEKNEIFAKAISGENISESESNLFKSNLIVDLARLYRKYGIAMQLHLKASRNNSERMFAALGPDSGFDAINGGDFIPHLSKMFSLLDKSNELPKTILYSLDANDWMALMALGYCFQEKGIAGKVQLGAAWWFFDNAAGMEKQLTVTSNVGLLSSFVGMVTDSRSFLSFTRHEYFRRVLCSYLGELLRKGHIPFDEKTLGEMVEDISYNNAYDYFIKGEEKNG